MLGNKKMETKLIAGLIIVVIALSIILIKTYAMMEEMRQSAGAAPSNNDRDTKLSHKKAPPFDLDDDWFSRPYDPDNWDPFAEMQRMQEHMNRMFNDAFGHFDSSPKYRGLAREPAFSPEIDVREEPNRFIIRIDVPGVDQGSLDVKVDGQRVTISGNRERVVDNTDKSGRMTRSERRYGRFARTIELSEPVDATRMEGKSEQGVFTVILPKMKS
jgi:HSP20 family protein